MVGGVGVLMGCCQMPGFHYNLTAMNLSNLTPGQLRQAAEIVEKIEALELELAAFTSDVPAPVKARLGRPPKVKLAFVTEPRSPKKGGMSAEKN